MSVDPTGYVAGVNLQQQRDKDLRKACKDFESVFTYELLKSMRKTIDKCELFHGGQGEEIYESLLDQELAKNMSGYGGNSLSELLYRQLSRLDSSSQEGQEAQRTIQSGYGSLMPLRPQTGCRSGSVTAAESKPAWPLKPVISSRFGLRKDPFTSETRLHSGVDIKAEKGTSVKAAMSGKVVMSCKMPDYGNVVAVDHGQGIVTVYAHNEKNMVKAGDQVEKGDVIGRVGSTGRSTGPHLHFEVRKNGVKIDPMEFMGAA